MLHFPFLQTPVSIIFPVPPSQVCPSVLAPAAAAFWNYLLGQDLTYEAFRTKLTIRVAVGVGVAIVRTSIAAAAWHGNGVSGQHGGDHPSES